MLCDGDSLGAAPAAEALLYPTWTRTLLGHQVVTRRTWIEISRPIADRNVAPRWARSTGDSNVEEALLERAFEGAFGHWDLNTFLAAAAREREESHEAVRRIGVLDSSPT